VRAAINQKLVESGEKEKYVRLAHHHRPPLLGRRLPQVWFGADIAVVVRATRLKEMLRTKLVQCGWRDEMKGYCRGTHKRCPSADCTSHAHTRHTAQHSSNM
jgi:CDGSH-type Zn-finger protein